ncbi:MAG: alpha/beta fold hydrolase [Phycisphaerales bacterium]|nr:alpha/beta fold hydrolase [Phycisphaerae bacterium]NNF44058.1 alpha/beta fold hydrolase [Phycisphaerales bacterium]NNM26155.1 alpha/beta fold hydrolase [Phycisphaerales bacterium]
MFERRESDRRPVRGGWRLVVIGLGLAAAGIFAAGGCMERLFYYPQREPTPPPVGFPGAERLDFTSADGTPLVGWFLPATGADPHTPAPAVLHAHGNAGNMTGHLWFTEALPERGFHLVLFDYRGYGESGGSARRRADLIADTHAALDAVLADARVDRTRVGLYAQSLGGAIGLNVMRDRPEIRAGVVVAAFTSWREIAADALGGSFLARGAARVLIRDSARPVDAIRHIDRPLLIVHGTEDDIVPVAHGRRLAAAAPDARFHPLEGGGHNDFRSSHPEVDELVAGFFREHLSAAAPAR